MARRLARLCAREPTERALWPRARFRSLYVSMLGLTLELSGLPMRRTPTVAIVANGAKDFFCQSFDWASLVEALRFDSGPPPLLPLPVAATGR